MWLFFYSQEFQILFFLVQEISSFSFLFFIFIKTSLFFLLLILFLKIAIVPLHFWLRKFLINLKWFEIICFFTFIKIAPFWLVFQRMTLKTCFLLIFIGILSSFFLLFSFFVKIIFLFSSSVHSSWIILLSYQRVFISLFYCVFYFLIFIFLLNSFKII